MTPPPQSPQAPAALSPGGLLRPFQRTDWYAWAGASRFGTQDPLIYDLDERFVVIVAGGDNGGLPKVYLQADKAGSLYPGESDEGFEYCYLEIHPGNTWADAVELGEWFADRLNKNDMKAWLIFRNLCKTQGH